MPRRQVAQIRTLGHTLERWSEEILNHHRTGASNGPTEGMNLCVKRIKRAGRGFSCFEHYRLRVLRCRRCHLAAAFVTASDQKPGSLLQRVEPSLQHPSATPIPRSWRLCIQRRRWQHLLMRINYRRSDRLWALIHECELAA